MKIAVAAAGRDPDAPTDPRFGRCSAFVIVETEDLSYTAVDNTANAQGSGAGIAAAQLVANTGAEAIIAGHFGPNAYGALAAGGLAVYSFAGGTVREAVTALQAGELKPVSNATVPPHQGLSGAARAVPPPTASATAQHVAARVEDLEAQLKDLRAQLDRLSQGKQG